MLKVRRERWRSLRTLVCERETAVVASVNKQSAMTPLCSGPGRYNVSHTSPEVPTRDWVTPPQIGHPFSQSDPNEAHFSSLACHLGKRQSRHDYGPF